MVIRQRKLWDTMMYYGSVGIRYLKMSILSGLEYPANLIGWLIANPFQFIIGFATIRFVVEQFGTLKGWAYEELAFLYGMSVLSHGLSIILFVQSWYLGYLAMDGELDRFLLRPLNTLFQFLFMEFNLIGVADLIPGIIVFAYGCVSVQFQWSLSLILGVAMTVLGATLIRGSIWMLCGSTVFWTKNVGRFNVLTMELYDRTSLYPLSIYPRGIQCIFTFIIPLGWITYYPVSEFMGKNQGFFLPQGMPLVSLLIGILLFMAACLVFNAGMGKYESAGN